MKKLLLLSAATLFVFGNCFGALTQVFLENFDGTLGVTNGASVTPAPTSGNWFLNSTFPNGTPSSTSSPNAYRDTVPAGGAGVFTFFMTNSFDCSGNNYVAFQFNQICKINPVSQGSIEVSIDGGANWTVLNNTHYRTNFYHPGANNFFGVGGKNYFSSAAYPTAWFPAQPNRIPDSTWWRNEVFDISAIASNQPDVRIRFKLLNFNGSGSATREYGWLIDDIDVEMAQEAPPTISLTATNAGTFTLGPFYFTVSIPQTGINCCNQVIMYYSVNNAPYQSQVLLNAALDLWTCTIPTIYTDFDTICYYFQANNFFGVEGFSPPTFIPYLSQGDPFSIPNAVSCFGVSSGIHFPYSAFFEPTNDGWYCDTLQPGSDWQWGQPTQGATNYSYSFPNCWDVDLHNRYASNTHAYLYTPVFSINPNTSNIKLSFWKNHNVQAGRDGFRMQYNFDQGSGGVWSTLGYKNDPKATNWYDTTIAGSIPTLQEGWSGNSGGFQYCEYFLQQFIGATGQLQFRFVFDSDNFGNTDGVSIDDFKMIVPPPQDAQMIAILKPGSSSPAGSQDSVRVRLRNVGSDTLLNFPIRYSVNGGPTESVIFSGFIAPADIVDYSLDSMYTIPTGAYTICVWTDVTGDADRTNDSACKTSVGVPLMTLPYKDNFDGASIWYDSSSTTTTKWELGTPGYGATNSPYSAPNSWDINLLTPYGNSASSVLISPLFNFTNKREVTMRFWQNRNLVPADDGMRIEYTTTGGGDDSLWFLLDTIGPNLEHQNWYTNSAPPLQSSGQPGWSNNSFGWKESKLVLRELDSAGAAVQFRFIFSSFVDPPLDGISIDNFSLKPASPIDPGIVEVVHPDIKGVEGDNDYVTVVIKNYGLTNLTSCPIRFSVNNGAFVSPPETWSGNLAMYETDTFTFLATYVVPASYYTLCAYTVLASDGDHDNDTSCNRPFGIPRKTITFSDNFDTGPQNWFGDAIDNITQWQLGTPNYGVTNSTHSAPTAWDINLTTEYKANANAQLYSPIFNFTNMYNARLNFWHNWSVQSKGDGVKLEYRTSLADTAPWILLDTLKNLYESNWYNDSSNFVPLKPANWTGASAALQGSANGWVQSKMMLKELNDKGADVQFRFVFRSNATVNGSGYSIDDFSITKAPDADIAGISIINPRKIGIAGDTDTVKAWIYNAGNLLITQLNLKYSINGGTPQSCPWTGTIDPGDSLLVTVCPIVIPARDYTLCFFPEVANDGDHSNDTVCVDLFGVGKYNISYYDTMNTLPQEFFKLEPGNEWEFGFPVSAAIYYSCSPPNCWKTKIGGNHSADRNDYLYSPFFNFSFAYKAEIRMCINYKSEPGNDGGRIDYSVDSGQTWHTLGRQGDGKGTNWYTTNTLSETAKPAWTGNSNGWVNASYQLDTLEYSPGLVQFRIHYAANNGGNNEGLAIDNFEIYNPHRFDIAPIAIDSLPNPFNMSGPQTIKVYVENRGSIDLAKYQITFTRDGTTMVSDIVTLTPPLPYRGITSHDMTQQWFPDVPARGGHDLCVYTFLPNDSNDLNRADDTLCMMAGILDSVVVNNANNQYCNDFDGTLTKWIPVNSYTQNVHGSNWMHGRPDKATISGTYSGAEAWATRLTGLYDPIDSSALYSPVFEVDSDGCYEVSFYHNFQMEDYQDGGVVEYSMDAGVTWHYLGYGFDQNWYNSVFITSLSRNNNVPGVAGWTGTSSGSWVYAAHNVKFYNPTHAVFRFRFGSDPSKEMEGWAMDNFCLKKIGPCTIGINEVENTGFAMSQNFPNPASEITSISYLIPSFGKVKLSISNILGQELQTIVDENQPAGQYMREVNVSALAEGIYYYTLEFEGQRLVGKMIIVE